uniref:LUD_dom domain-containing protein n=1 Tax=Caenorhabditis tropicalis TaxID=1561998 RepID=A0A1I7U244_9PELO
MSESPIADQLISLIKYKGRLFVSDKSYDSVMAAIDGLEGIFRGLEYAGDLKALIEEGAPKRKWPKHEGKSQQAGDRTPKYGTSNEFQAIVIGNEKDWTGHGLVVSNEPKTKHVDANSKDWIQTTIQAGHSKQWNGKTLVIHSKINDILIDQKDPQYLQFTLRAAVEAENKRLLETAGMTWVLCTGKDYHAKKTLKLLQLVGKAKGVILPKNADPKIKELYVQNGYRVEEDWEKSKDLITGEK